MRTMTASEASRSFSDLLDVTERGETITITRGRHPVAEMGPPRRRTGADLRTALADIEPPDDHLAEDIAAALAQLTTEGCDPVGGRLILDTNVLIAYERGTIDRSGLDEDELAVAAITIAEHRCRDRVG